MCAVSGGVVRCKQLCIKWSKVLEETRNRCGREQCQAGVAGDRFGGRAYGVTIYGCAPGVLRSSKVTIGRDSDNLDCFKAEKGILLRSSILLSSPVRFEHLPNLSSFLYFSLLLHIILSSGACQSEYVFRHLYPPFSSRVSVMPAAQ